jgi:hypothetical protein
MKASIFSSLLISGLLAFPGLGAPAAQPTEPALTPPAFSAGINDVVNLVQSGVEDSVVIAFIKSSSVAFQPSADEILKLRGLGISSPAITAMLERGGELRRQAPATPPVAYPGYNPSAPAPAAQPAPTYAETTAAEPVSAEPVSSVVYIGSSYPAYTYPYYNYYSYYPWGWYYPFSYCGYYPYSSWTPRCHEPHPSGWHCSWRGYYSSNPQSGYHATARPYGAPGSRPADAYYNGGAGGAHVAPRPSSTAAAGNNFRGPAAGARPSGARGSGGRPVNYISARSAAATVAPNRPVNVVAPRRSVVQVSDARVSNTRFIGGGVRATGAAPRSSGVQIASPRMSAPQMSAPRTSGMQMSGARFSGGGMRHR